MGGCRAEEVKGEKKWDNCNSIINKIYLKKKKEITQRILYGITYAESKRAKLLATVEWLVPGVGEVGEGDWRSQTM